RGDAHYSFVMNVDSGMPGNPNLLPILLEELVAGAHWQVIAIGAGGGRWNIWDLHRRVLELGGNVRTGLEDTLYLPGGERVADNGRLVEALVRIARETGREPASPGETRRLLNFSA
ncbi:MAG: 3-keto-5-aminohexanoate cleavage protein, partial [Thermodesulfobacteriota bacterium]